mmetsp:Transcript_32551/g.105153  ORF Transcript_32551/g.105153 Transcript_32551/m.105153 type:complete len:268 (-) Transcript_32551:932-1735(-)
MWAVRPLEAPLARHLEQGHCAHPHTACTLVAAKARRLAFPLLAQLRLQLLNGNSGSNFGFVRVVVIVRAVVAVLTEERCQVGTRTAGVSPCRGLRIAAAQRGELLQVARVLHGAVYHHCPRQRDRWRLIDVEEVAFDRAARTVVSVLFEQLRQLRRVNADDDDCRAACHPAAAPDALDERGAAARSGVEDDDHVRPADVDARLECRGGDDDVELVGAHPTAEEPLVHAPMHVGAVAVVRRRKDLEVVGPLRVFFETRCAQPFHEARR